MGKKHLNIAINQNVIHSMKQIALKQKTTLHDIVEEVLQDFIDIQDDDEHTED